MERSDRQKAAYDWTVDAFGPEHAMSAPMRATRFIEEGIELYQTCGGNRVMLHRLVDFVFNKPPGDLKKEIGDVGLTLLTVAELSGFDADVCEAMVVAEALATDPAAMRARNAVKNAAGFDAGAYPVEPPPRNLYAAYGPGSITDAATYDRCECGKRFKSNCVPPTNCEG